MPAPKPKEVVSILEKAGYYIDHTTGSHYIMRHPDYPQRIPVPYHAKDIKKRRSALNNQTVWVE